MIRRNFIKTVALTGSAISVSPGYTLYPADPKKVGIGFLGVGSRGRNYLRMKNKIIFLFLVVLSTGIKAQPEFSSHRGSSVDAPENTIASVNLAWEQGADAVEIDVYLSKDNRLMVIHDSNTKRTSGQDYLVKATSSDILRELDVGSFKDEKFRGERIPFLEEVIATVPPNKKLIIELKCGTEGLPFLKNVVAKCGKKRQLDFICFDFQTITAAKKMFPKNKCHWLMNGKEGLEEKLKTAAKAKLDAVDIRHSDIDEKIVKLAHKLNLDVVAWTIDDPVEAERLIGLGVDGIESNCVPCLKSKLSEKQN